MIKFSNEFFEDEVREGFYVSGMMKKAWAAQMEVMVVIDKICKKHGLHWYADSGTLLGAVRHKGYIPWDDDVDISMLRDEYEKFISVVEKELPKGYKLKSVYKDEPTYELFVRVVNTEYYSENTYMNEQFHGFCFPVGVDIFPFDFVSDDEERENARYHILKVISGAIGAVEKEIETDYESLVAEVEEMTGYTIDKSMSMYRQLYICMDQVAQFFDRSESSYVTLIPYYIKDKGYKCRLDCFNETILLPFEEILVNAPAGYEGVLTCEYGNYMELVKGGGDHNYPFFKKIEDSIKGYKEQSRFYYKFRKEHLDNSERNSFENVKDRVTKFSTLLIRMVEVLQKSLDSEHYDKTKKVLVATQTACINMGEYIEGKKGLNTLMVHNLEECCELLYQIYELSLTESRDIRLEESLENIICEFQKNVEQELSDYKEIVFLTYKAKYWDKFKERYEYHINKGHKVMVIPLPCYEINATGEFGELIYNDKGYPDDVEITDYKEYDIETNQADVIYIQLPYDECNRVFSIPPYYYSRNIKKYTKKLVYIPFFDMDEITDEKYEQTMEYFCTVPGVVHSDETIVQSPQMRQAYIDKLTSMSGEEYRFVWEEKIKSRCL